MPIFFFLGAFAFLPMAFLAGLAFLAFLPFLPFFFILFELFELLSVGAALRTLGATLGMFDSEG
jgi:hypothetical protein